MKKNIFKFLIPTSLVAAAPLALAACNTNNADSEKLNKENADLKSQITALNTKLTEANKKVKEANDKLDVAIGLKSNVWNSFSGDKVAQSLQAYANAKVAFDKMITQDMISTTNVKVNADRVALTKPDEGKSIPVVFMDLDETVLDNFKLQNYFLLNGKTYDYNLWSEFVSAGISEEVPGAIDFIKYVWSKGGVVMFNSNRKMSEHKQGSFNNLKALKLDEKYMPDWIWWMKGVDTKSATPWTTTNGFDNKETRMNAVSDKKFTIDGVADISFKVVMRVGDDISDFNDNFTKSKEISLQSINSALYSDESGYGKLFGNTDLNNKSVTYDDKTKTWTKQQWSASYVFIPGNQVYGSWIKQIIGSNDLEYEKSIELIKEYSWKK